jgi:hypothetical protein
LNVCVGLLGSISFCGSFQLGKLGLSLSLAFSAIGYASVSSLSLPPSPLLSLCPSRRPCNCVVPVAPFLRKADVWRSLQPPLPLLQHSSHPVNEPRAAGDDEADAASLIPNIHPGQSIGQSDSTHSFSVSRTSMHRCQVSRQSALASNDFRSRAITLQICAAPHPSTSPRAPS